MPASDVPAAGSESDAPDEDGEADPDRPRVALTRTDERVLAYLDDAGTDYPAFVASNTGLYADHVESRLDALEAGGLVERVTGEAVYRITDYGRDALRDDCAPWSD
ncbi:MULTISPECIES: DUF2250 domain-containing protein [unclassified Halorubrum]|uniref:DUF2250 domain-containing protein n=1 Tax=unclassified Halorubrum TaxID=2642239 RepID=UPI000B99B08C|nr:MULTISPECIES: DUF2250 domain-containing protein [unclassified Halorubrum]OYR42616.1 hypothetical protein DJ75_12770 [Halorubrum sp. Eb13]OYR49136.1 hypothetical protein DJ73_18170 [Halorubrum sp. Ea1]